MSPPRSWTSALALLAGLALLAAFATSCQKNETVRKTDLEKFHTLLDQGLSYQQDPYVRAESLRILEMIDHPQFDSRIEPLLKDDAPMVRVAALRAMMARHPKRATGHASSLFKRASAAEKRAIFEAALEYTDESFQRDLLWRALESSQPASVRRFAVRRGLVMRVQTAIDNGEGELAGKYYLAKAQSYVDSFDTEIGGPILRLMLQLGKTERAETAVEGFADESNSVDERLRAARVLIEAAADSAKPAFLQVIEEAKVDPNSKTLAVPEKQVDERIVRAAVLGLVAAGEADFVRRAKRYMKDASEKQYTDVLEALAHNPSESARLAIENAMRDARPRVRYRAIELYGQREDAEIDALFNVLQNKSFEVGTKKTRQKIARVIGDKFSNKWVSRLRGQLNSDEGIRPALRLLRYVYNETKDTELLTMLKSELVEIADSQDQNNAPLAAFLLVRLPQKEKSDEIVEIIRSARAPLPRYAHIEQLVRTNPSEHVGFLLENFYAEKGAPELFAIRLMSGAGLWLAEKGGAAGDEKSGEEPKGGRADADS